METAFRAIRLPAMQADVFRIAKLLAHGSVWIDAATICYSLDKWLDRHQPLLAPSKASAASYLTNSFIYAADPDHPLLLQACRMAPLLLARSGEKIYRDFGPGVLRDLIADGSAELQIGLQIINETRPIAH